MTGKWQNTECYHQSPFSSPVPSISFLDIYIPHISSQVFCRWKEEKMIDISVRKLIRISLKWWTVLRECPNLRAINLLTACRKSAKKRNGLSLKFCSMLLFYDAGLLLFHCMRLLFSWNIAIRYEVYIYLTFIFWIKCIGLTISWLARCVWSKTIKSKLFIPAFS